MPLRQEVQNFISACEHLYDFLARGGALTDDERGVLEIAAIEFLAKIRPDNGPRPQRPTVV